MNLTVAATGFKHKLAKRYSGPFWIRRKNLQRTQWMTEDDLKEYQLKRLKKIVNYAYKYIPYYQLMMKKYNIQPSNIRTLNDIKLFPITTKENVQAAGQNIVSGKIPKCLMTTAVTGGTTGSPLRIKRDVFSISNEHAFVKRQWDWAGLKMSDRTAFLCGREFCGITSENVKPYGYDPFMKELFLSTYHLTADTAEQFLNVISEYNVKAIAGYTSAINFLACKCIDMKMEIKLKAAFTTSETIDQVTIDNISKAFGCKVYDFYGAAERVCYIFTCEKGRYHILPEYGLTELIPENGGGREGICRIVATGFWNFATPLIRYDTKDLVKVSDEKCPCRRHFKVVDKIIGRTGDQVKTPGGRIMGPQLLVRAIKYANNIIEAQVVQDSLDHLSINFVPSQNFTENDFVHFRNYVSKRMPSDLKVDLKPVEKINRTKTGKMKFIDSRI